MPQAQEGPDREPPVGTPRWVKIFGLIALLIALLVAVMLLSGGEHGPGRHLRPASSHALPIHYSQPQE